MFKDLLTAIRETAAASLPTGVYAADRILYDALDKDITPTNLRTVNITSQQGLTARASMGGPSRFRTIGILYVRLYEPTGKGDGVQLDHATAIADYLRERVVTKGDVEIRFRAPSLVNAPRENSMWVRIVQVEFRADVLY